MTKSLRIAVADDEPEMREFLQKMLPRLGHQVVVAAENGAALVECCRQALPDLVISDLKMPQLDGLMAASQLCRERAVPVILISAYHDHNPQLVAGAAANHVQVCLVKPIGLADLEPAIALAMQRFAELAALRACSELRQALAGGQALE